MRDPEKESFDERQRVQTQGRHLITQNLLSSARLFEERGPIPASAVDDLAAFIDVFCLYDELLVLGTPDTPGDRARESDFLGMVRDSGVVAFVTSDLCGSGRMPSIAAAAKLRFAAFQNFERPAPDDDEVIERLLGTEAIMEHWNASGRFLHIVDSSHDVGLGLDRLRTELLAGAKGSAWFDSTALTFVLRTFLYLAYAETEALNLTLDSSRGPLANRLLEGEEQFRRRVLSHLRDVYGAIPGAAELRSTKRLSPFAAVVFRRARGDKRLLVPEMRRLRTELADVRTGLQELEGKLTGSYKDALKAETTLNRALAEIRRRYTAAGHEATVNELGRFGVEAAGAGLDVLVSATTPVPTVPTKWIETVLGLPVVWLRRLFGRRRLVRIHQLFDDKQVPAPLALRQSIRELFGDLVPYGEPYESPNPTRTKAPTRAKTPTKAKAPTKAKVPTKAKPGGAPKPRRRTQNRKRG